MTIGSPTCMLRGEANAPERCAGEAVDSIEVDGAAGGGEQRAVFGLPAPEPI